MKIIRRSLIVFTVLVFIGLLNQKPVKASNSPINDTPYRIVFNDPSGYLGELVTVTMEVSPKTEGINILLAYDGRYIEDK